MKLIVEVDSKGVYCYLEKERHFKAIRSGRGTRRIKSEDLKHECELEVGDYVIIPVDHNALRRFEKDA